MKLKKMRRSLCVMLALFLAMVCIPVMQTFAAKEMYTIKSVSISGIEVPLAGAKPDFTAEVTESRCELGANAVQWDEYDEGWEWQAELTANSTFKKDYWYVVTVTVNAKTDYAFDAAVTGSINGQSANNAGKPTASKAGFYISFQCTDTAITNVELTVVNPAVGKTPTFARVNTTQYESKNNDPKLTNQTNGVVWTNMSSGVNLSVSNPFKENVSYSVSYTLYPKSGYQFYSNLTATINGKKALVRFEDGYIIVRLENMVAEYKPITSAAITGVTPPAAGKNPSYDITATGSFFAVQGENDDARVNGVYWAEFEPGSFYGLTMKKTDVFKPGYVYKLYIDLVPTDSAYAFVQDQSVVTVNGKEAFVTVDGRNARAIYTFEALPAQQIVPGVSVNCIAPVAGKTPNYNISTAGSHYAVVDQDNDYWVNGVAWVEFVPGSGSGTMIKKTDTFKAGNKYGIIMDVTVTTENYAFAQDATTATVNGKAATLNIDGKTAHLMYVFPALSQMTISKVDVNVTAPAAGAKPSFDQVEGVGYYSDNNGNAPAVFKNGVAWFKTPSSYITAGTTETFEAGKEYTLKISMSAKEGYAFSRSLTATVNGKTATVTQFDDGSIMLEVVLTTPAAPHTHTPSDWQTDDGYHWQICTDAECGSILGRREMHLNTDEDGKCDTCGYQLPVEVPEVPDEPADPADPTNPTEPSQPAEPADPTEPTVPAEPDDPTEPTVPAAPSQPKDETVKTDNTWVWIALGSAAVVLGGAAIVIAKKKR